MSPVQVGRYMITGKWQYEMVLAGSSIDTLSLSHQLPNTVTLEASLTLAAKS